MYIRNFALASLLIALSSKAEENGPMSPSLGLRGSDGAQDESNLAGDTFCGSSFLYGDNIRLGGFNGDNTDEKVWGCADKGASPHRRVYYWTECCKICGRHLQNEGKMKAGWGCEIGLFIHTGIWLRGCNTHGQTCTGDTFAQDVAKAEIN